MNTPTVAGPSKPAGTRWSNSPLKQRPPTPSTTRPFDEKTLRLSLPERAQRSYGDGNTVNQAFEEERNQGIAHSMADGTFNAIIRHTAKGRSMYYVEVTHADFILVERATSDASTFTPPMRDCIGL